MGVYACCQLSSQACLGAEPCRLRPCQHSRQLLCLPQRCHQGRHEVPSRHSPLVRPLHVAHFCCSSLTCRCKSAASCLHLSASWRGSLLPVCSALQNGSEACSHGRGGGTSDASAEGRMAVCLGSRPCSWCCCSRLLAATLLVVSEVLARQPFVKAARRAASVSHCGQLTATA